MKIELEKEKHGLYCVVVEAFRFLGSQSEPRALKFPALVADHSPVAQQAGAQTHT